MRVLQALSAIKESASSAGDGQGVFVSVGVNEGLGVEVGLSVGVTGFLVAVKVGWAVLIGVAVTITVTT